MTRVVIAGSHGKTNYSDGVTRYESCGPAFELYGRCAITVRFRWS